MKTQRSLTPLLALLLLTAGCASTAPGNDPVIVNAQQVMSNAKATFELIEKTEFETYSAFKSANPGMAAQVRTFVNKLRSDSPQWLNTAYSLTETYRTNRTDQNKADLNTAIAVLQAAITKSQEYLALMPKG